MHHPNHSTRKSAISAALETFDSGRFLADLNRRVSYRTESQVESSASQLHAYLRDEIAPTLGRLGFTFRIVANPAGVDAPILLAERIEEEGLPTVVTYAHGDVVRGYDDQWRKGLEPWKVVVEGDRWYGRGTADNKGQHSINIAALESVIAVRSGRIGYNIKLIFETGEEIDSPGLGALCAAEKDFLTGDLFLASDGPRVAADRPTIFLGSRGELNFELEVDLRDGAHHSGNWGGALRNPAVVLSHAIATLIDKDGRILVKGLLPPPISPAVRAAISDLALGSDEHAPAVDPSWGEPGLTPAERVWAWNALEVIAFKAGNPDAPVGAIPPTARAHCQLRYVVGTNWENAHRHLEEHLAAKGIASVKVTVQPAGTATRLDLKDPWVEWALRSIEASTGKKPALLPNIGGTVPNAIFAETLGLPTVWVPHSYAACSQHAPNEHLLGSVAREALAVMAGIWWDLGDDGADVAASRKRRIEA
ncbi:M20 family metallopeptidase [Variovorax paradoxus]|uniref:M20 family metallopeptidase n=1 Tax=Variovorax paradoxus TaxID=34073 RepID=UPI0029C82473|nr:M20 family metallopeptidase [Variovorax paradoxus]